MINGGGPLWLSGQNFSIGQAVNLGEICQKFSLKLLKILNLLGNFEIMQNFTLKFSFFALDIESR